MDSTQQSTNARRYLTIFRFFHERMGEEAAIVVDELSNHGPTHLPLSALQQYVHRLGGQLTVSEREDFFMVALNTDTVHYFRVTFNRVDVYRVETYTGCRTFALPGRAPNCTPLDKRCCC